jgi:hypothetical protein
MGSFQSGQMELAVNQLGYPFGGSNPSLPTMYEMLGDSARAALTPGVNYKKMTLIW